MGDGTAKVAIPDPTCGKVSGNIDYFGGDPPANATIQVKNSLGSVSTCTNTTVPGGAKDYECPAGSIIADNDYWLIANGQQSSVACPYCAPSVNGTCDVTISGGCGSPTIKTSASLAQHVGFAMMLPPSLIVPTMLRRRRAARRVA